MTRTISNPNFMTWYYIGHMIDGLKVSNKWAPISGSPIVNVSRVHAWFRGKFIRYYWNNHKKLWVKVLTHILLVKPIQSTWKCSKYHWILVHKVWWLEYPYFLLFLFSLGIVWGFSIFGHEHEPLIDIKVAPIRAFSLNYHTPNDFHH